MNIITSDLAI